MGHLATWTKEIEADAEAHGWLQDWSLRGQVCFCCSSKDNQDTVWAQVADDSKRTSCRVVVAAQPGWCCCERGFGSKLAACHSKSCVPNSMLYLHGSPAPQLNLDSRMFLVAASTFSQRHYEQAQVRIGLRGGATATSGANSACSIRQLAALEGRVTPPRKMAAARVRLVVSMHVLTG